eukprot:351628-Chlamydomonas_euryale.AAC.5
MRSSTTVDATGSSPAVGSSYMITRSLLSFSSHTTALRRRQRAWTRAIWVAAMQACEGGGVREWALSRGVVQGPAVAARKRVCGPFTHRHGQVAE